MIFMQRQCNEKYFISYLHTGASHIIDIHHQGRQGLFHTLNIMVADDLALPRQ